MRIEPPQKISRLDLVGAEDQDLLWHRLMAKRSTTRQRHVVELRKCCRGTAEGQIFAGGAEGAHDQTRIRPTIDNHGPAKLFTQCLQIADTGIGGSLRGAPELNLDPTVPRHLKQGSRLLEVVDDDGDQRRPVRPPP